MNDYVKHEQKYFGMLNNAVAIGDTSLEGGAQGAALDYYQYLLLREFPDCPIGFNLPTEQEEAIKKGMADLISIDATIAQYFKTFPSNMDDALNKVIEDIQKNCQETNACYLPSGWVGRTEGHFAPLKCRKLENGKFALSLINHGAGMEYHREAPKQGTKGRRLYQSNEYEVDLISKDGKELLQRLIEIQFKYKSRDETGNEVNEYSDKDLYGLLKLYAKEMPLTDKIDQKAVTPQRKGSCTVTNTHAVGRDILVNLGADLKARKRYHFVLKLRSLLHGFEAYKKGDYDRNVLQWGLNEFSVRVNKEYANVLTEDEVTYCGKLQNEIQVKLDADKQAEIKEKSAPKAFPSATGAPPEDLSINIIKKTEEEEEVKRKKENISADRVHSYEMTPENVVKILGHSKYRTTFPLKKIMDYLQSFPHCSGKEKDEFWDRVPRADIPEIIECLALISAGICSDYSKTTDLEKQRLVAISLMIYDIVAQLRTGPTYALGLDEGYSELSQYTDPEIYYTVKRIAQNFEERAKGKDRVLTNQVRPKGDKSDNTIHYLVNEMIDQVQRDALISAFGKGRCTDLELFQKIFGVNMDLIGRESSRNLSRNVDAAKKILGPTYFYVVQISGSAQSKGESRITYTATTDGEYYCFSKTQFYWRLDRKFALSAPESAARKHLPILSSETMKSSFTDFSENTLYHPKSDLLALREEYADFTSKSRKIKHRRHPYQLYNSGSVKPDSQPWVVRDRYEHLFEELDEQFRHIECSPHLQVIRTLAWLTKNPEKLHFEEVRTRIYELLFAYGKLDAAFANQWELTLQNITDCFIGLINYCREEEEQDPQVLSWLGKLSNDLGHFAEVSGKVYGVKLEGQGIPSFEESLLQAMKISTNAKGKALVAKELVRSYQHKKPLTLDDCALLLSCRLIESLGGRSPETEELWKFLQSDLQSTINQNLEEFNQKLGPLLNQYLNIPAGLNWEINGNELFNSNNDFVIDLNDGSLKRRGTNELKDMTDEVFQLNLEALVRSKINRDSIKFYYDGSVIRSSDAKWTLTPDLRYGGFQIARIAQRIDIEGSPEEFLYDQTLGDFSGNQSPFESNQSLNTHYQYWRSDWDKFSYFLRQENTDLAYFYSRSGGQIIQLKANEQGIWKRTGYVMLNLVKPKTDLEVEWGKRLGPLLGVNDSRCLAKLSADGKTCTLERIEHQNLGLNFTLDSKNCLTWDEDPEYHLAPELGLSALQGLPSVIQLVNEKKEMKLIIPAFAFNAGEKNNAFNQAKLIDAGTLRHKDFKYFECSFDDHKELQTTSVEGNMYLAILYRSLGDYKRAMHYLDRCKTHEKLSETTLSIAMQTLRRKIQSPQGAAFDIKLDCYIQEHRQKWTGDINPIEVEEVWQEWILGTQLPLYRDSLSSYKAGVSILPAYCRLSPDEIAVISKEPISFANKMGGLRTVIPNERVIKASTLKDNLWSRKDMKSWENCAKSILGDFENRCPGDAHEGNTWRIFDNRATYGAGFAYAFYFFSDLLKEAISQDPARVKVLQRKLYAILMNDKYPLDNLYPMIAILTFACKYPEYFSNFRFEPLEKKKGSVILEAGKVLIQHQDELKLVKLPLIEFESFSTEFPAPQPLPADFPPKPVHFAIAPIKEEEAYKHPLQSIADHYFSRELKPLATREFALDPDRLTNPTPIELRLLKQYEDGHKENQTKKKIVYKVNPGLSLDQMKQDLIKIRDEDKTKVDRLNTSLWEKANKLPDNESKAYNLLLSRASEQHQVISISDLFVAYLNQDPSYLTSRNPLLEQKDIETLFSELSDYALIKSRINQADQTLADLAEKKDFNELKPYELQLMASTMDKSRAYTIEEYPEFLVYEYATKKILRKDQFDTLVKIIHLLEADSTDPDAMHHALLQFAAGGGKTSVMIPILAHRFARKGFLPVIFNTNELYTTGLEDIPKNLRASLQQNMEVVERELEHQWSVEELQLLLKDLTRWRSEHKCLLLKPVTWHSLNIARKLAYLDGNRAVAQAAENVLDFFKSQTIKLEDECHIISDPLQQSIKTRGLPLKIPQDQLDLMLKFYDQIMGYAPNSHEIVRLAGIQSNQKQVVNAENLSLLQIKLAKAIAMEPCFAPCKAEDLIQYLNNPDRTRPDWLKKLYRNDSDTADLVVLARAFIQTHLPHIMTMQMNKDYGVSIHPGDLTAAPKHEGKDVTSHFGDHSLVAALTIQLFEQRGLMPYQVNQLLDTVIAEHKKERRWNFNAAVKTSAELWLKHFDSIGYSINSIQDLTPALRAKMSSDPRVTKHPPLIKRFLKDIALPQIHVPPTQQSSTPAEMQAGFSRSLLLSATPGLPEIYPAVLPRENCFLEEAFEAQVIDTLLSPENARFCHLNKAQTPAEFFEELPPEILENITTMIDRGALLTDFDGLEVINAYLNLDKSKSRATSTGVYFSKYQTHLKLESKGVIDIPGTALVETLKKHRIKPEDFLLFLFMDLSKTTGVDIKRPFYDQAGLTVGKEQTVTETIQAAMRERQLLDENAQTVTWIMFQSLYKEINPEAPADSFDPRDVFYWMIKNEAKQFSSKLASRAYQGIEHEIHQVVWQMWRDDPDGFPFDYQHKLMQFKRLSPWGLYEQESIEENTKPVLENFRDKLFQQFGLDKNDSRVPVKTRERIALIIEQTSALILKLDTSPKSELGNEVMQEMKMQTELNVEQKLQQTLKKRIDSATDFIFAAESFEGTKLNTLFDAQIEPIVLPGCEAIDCPNLLFNQNHFRALQPSNQKGLEFDQLKPIEMILVKIMPNGKKQYRACTAEEGDIYSIVLNKNVLTDRDPCYLILTSEGAVLSCSNNITPNESKVWSNIAETERILAYANFLSGRIPNPLAMRKLIKEYKWSKADYEKMANSIASMQVSTRSAILVDNDAVYKLCGWGTEPAPDFEMAVGDERVTTTEVPMRALQVVSSPEIESVTFTPPKIQPERALENYVFETMDTRDEMVKIKERLLTLEAEVEAYYNEAMNEFEDARYLEPMSKAVILKEEFTELKQTFEKLGKIFDSVMLNEFENKALASYANSVQASRKEQARLHEQYVPIKVAFIQLKAGILAEKSSRVISKEINDKFAEAETLIGKIESNLSRNTSVSRQNLKNMIPYLQAITQDIEKLNTTQLKSSSSSGIKWFKK